MPADPSSGERVSVSAELRRQAQESVRECVTSAAAQGREGRRWVVPLAASAAVAAAACAPVVWPLLVGAGGAVVAGAALAQVGGVGGGLLSEAVIRAWDRLRSRGGADAGQAGLRDALAAELEAGLTLDAPAAAALRGEVAGVLRGVDAVQVALTATVDESAAGVREVLVQGLRELGEEFTEFGWVLDEVNRQLAVIAEDVPRPRPPPARSPITSNRPWWSWPCCARKPAAHSALGQAGPSPRLRLVRQRMSSGLLRWMPLRSRSVRSAPTRDWRRFSQKTLSGFTAVRS